MATNLAPTLAEALSVVADSAVLVRERCGTDRANETTQAFLALCLAVEADHGVVIQCAGIRHVCPFVRAAISSPFALVPLHRALRRALGPSNTDARYAAQYDIDEAIEALDRSEWCEDHGRFCTFDV